MSEPKLHHEIPQLLLRNFTNDRGQLFCYRKQDEKTFRTSPQNVFARSRFYTKRDDDGFLDDASKEQELAIHVEKPAKPVIEKIVTNARTRHLPELSTEEKYVWDLFFCVQCRRTDAALQDLEDSNLMDWAINEVEMVMGPFSEEERDIIYGSPDWGRTAIRNAWIDTLTTPFGELFDALRAKGLYVFVIEDSEKSFIVGDLPIIPMIPNGETLNHSNAGNFFPIAKDVAVVCEGVSGDETLNLIPRDAEGTELLEKINLSILDQSSMIAGPSCSLIESLRQDQQRSGR